MLAEDSITGFLLAFIPATINVGILIYIMLYLPKGRLVKVFSLLLISLIALQLEHSLVRLHISASLARYVNQVFSMGWLAMGSLSLHFVAVLTQNNIVNSRYFYFLVYGPYFLFFSAYHANPNPIPFIPSETWGYITEMRPGSLDLIQRYWMASMVYMAIGILLHFSLTTEKNDIKKKQAQLVILGMLIPSIQGLITQAIFPFLGIEQIPITSTSITFLSGAIIIALTKYKLFDFFEFIRTEKILEKMSNPIFCISPNDEIVYSNSAFEKLFLKESHATNLPVAHLFLSKDDYRDFYKKVLKNSQSGGVRNYETMMQKYSGASMNMLISSQPIYNNRKLQAILIFAVDITDRIFAEEKLRESNERYKIVSKATAEIVWDLDLQKNLIYWGEGYNRVFGYKIKKNFTNLEHWEKRVHPDDFERIVRGLGEYIQDNKTQKWETEYKYLKYDGSYAHVLDRGYIIRNSMGVATRMIGAMQDVSNIKKYIKQIENQNTKLNEIAWLQSHVVRAPLAKIMSISNILERDEQPAEEKKILFDALNDSCNELDKVIRTINEKTENLKQ